MNKTIRAVQTYLVLAFPFVIAVAVWHSLQQNNVGVLDQRSIFATVAWEILSWNLMLWFAVLFGFLVALVFSSEAREATLTRLANIKDRDEREKYITGQAARSAYLSTLSIMILLLVLSVVNLRVTNLPAGTQVDGKTKAVSIGINLSLTEETQLSSDSKEQAMVESKGIPLSKTAIIFALLAWQLFMFNRTARKEMLSA
jgi:hypothetical protein